MTWVHFWIPHSIKAMPLPTSIPLNTIVDAALMNTFAMALSVIPKDFSVPIVEMLRNSIIRSPEIMLNPATIVIKTRMNRTLKSIRFSQSKIWG